ncbi:MAG: exodeoxyribonuclease III [Cyanobacteriota bacterium]|nr:exodeoxyribonuclease III [Cyanobacteriota bacterium]
MKIATWNVNSIRTRQDIVVEWLQQTQVDILCLQETKVVDEIFPKAPFENIGYHLYISGQKAYNGVAIFSRSPLQDVSRGFTPILGEELVGDFDIQKRLIAGTFEGVRIISTYVPNGGSIDSDKYQYKLRWLELLRQYLDQQIDKETQLCICGDFNIAPDDRDIHTPTTPEDKIVGTTPPERQALKEILDLGLTDAFRAFTQEGGIYSWWDYRAAAFRRNRGWRIDHHYLTPRLSDRAIGCTIDVAPRKLPKPSDHTPVIVELA